MKQILLSICAFLLILSQNSFGLTKGFTLTEIGVHKYDAILGGNVITESQLIVDHLYEIGVRHIILSPRATMSDPEGNTLTPMTPVDQREDEKMRYLRLITYIQGKGMTVGIRPIFFVVNPDGSLPYVEILADGTEFVRWHGNIQPSDPTLWFQSFTEYLTPYLDIARAANIAEFTIGAELQSMTVGDPDINPFGYPQQWLSILRYAKNYLSKDTRVEYDINFTDEAVVGLNGSSEIGGEFAIWRQRLTQVAFKTNQEYESWKALSTLWSRLDGIGVDVYRSLADTDTIIPTDYEELVQLLKLRTDEIVNQFDYALQTIKDASNVDKRLTIKEIGFRSVENGFIDPYTYDLGTGIVNIEHQAAAFEAVFRSFFSRPLPWFGGIGFWDASVDISSHGPFSTSFSPVGKPLTEDVIRHYFSTLVR